MSSGIQQVSRCQKCSSFQTLFLRTLLNHYNSLHKNEINFSVKCDVKSCALNFSTYNSYYKHVRAHHNDIRSLKSIERITSPGNLIEPEQVVFSGNVEFKESEESDDSYGSRTMDDDIQPKSEESAESEYEEEDTLPIPVSHYTSEKFIILLSQKDINFWKI